MISANYDLNIFINCPFDKKYIPLMNALLFTIYYCGYIPRCALEESNGGDVRYKKILKLISDSKHGVHDISRTELDRNSKLPRFNMPFELGLFLGAKELGSRLHKTKNCLILDKEMYRYQAFLSDIAGSDIKAHDNNDKKIIKIVRNWIATFSPKPHPSGAYIASKYQIFTRDLPAMKRALFKTASKEIEYSDYSMLVSEWIQELTRNDLPAKKIALKKLPAKKAMIKPSHSKRLLPMKKCSGRFSP